MARVIGIDLGTTNSCVAILEGGQPKVIEYNVRFGDPECQPLLMRLKTDLLDLLEATVDERLEGISPPEWAPRASPRATTLASYKILSRACCGPLIATRIRRTSSSA